MKPGANPPTSATQQPPRQRFRDSLFSGSLSNQWTVPDFSPNEYLPRGVRLAGYFGDAADLPREVFQDIVNAVAAGDLAFPVHRVYDGLEQVPQAHDDMENNRATGKLVVRVRH